LDHLDVLKVDVADVKVREEVIASLPSLLGIDLLSKFEFVATDREAYLEL
jgi:hypothetical protein